MATSIWKNRPQCPPKTRYRPGLWIFLIQSVHDCKVERTSNPAQRAEPADGFTFDSPITRRLKLPPPLALSSISAGEITRPWIATSLDDSNASWRPQSTMWAQCRSGLPHCAARTVGLNERKSLVPISDTLAQPPSKWRIPLCKGPTGRIQPNCH